MHQQRVYAVTVSWYNKDDRRPPGTRPVLLRLLMAGAQVVPSEQPLDPGKRDPAATFYVTPLAKGFLRGERLEVLVDGRKVQEIPLSAKVTSQRMTCALLALTILVPWLLLSYCKYAPLEPSAREIKEFRDRKNKHERTRAQVTPGEVLESRIKENLPTVPDLISDNVPEAEEYLVSAPTFIGNVYDQLWMEMKLNNRPVALYAVAGLLFLVLVSWFVHREKRKRRTGAPIPLPAGASVPLPPD
jgi:hypothetical protein